MRCHFNVFMLMDKIQRELPAGFGQLCQDFFDVGMELWRKPVVVTTSNLLGAAYREMVASSTSSSG